jgi:hypothetical protein
MPSLKQVVKSKTFTLSTAYFAVFEILSAYDIEVKQRAILGGFVILSWILRLLTVKPLSSK